MQEGSSDPKKQLPKKRVGWVAAGVIFGIPILLGAVFGSGGPINTSTVKEPAVQSKTAHTQNSSQNTTKVETKTEFKQEDVPFELKTVDDNTLIKGTSKVTQVGVAGQRSITYEVTYTDGVETSRSEKSNIITKQPTNQVTNSGTYVAPVQTTIPSTPSGSGYINSSGNYVPSPTYAPSAPAGASAKCRDGTYSFSQSRSGTCSHHGGVATWL